LLCRRELAAAPAEATPTAAAVPAAAKPNPTAASAPSDAQDAPGIAAPSLAARQISIRVPTSLLLLPFVGAGFYYLATTETASPAAPAPLSATSAVAAPAPGADPPAARPLPGIPALVIEEPPKPERRAMNGRSPEAPAPVTPGLRDDATRGDASRKDAARARRELEAQEIANLRERVDVIVYYTSWCPACRKLRAYLAERGIRSSEYDIENDSAAKTRQRALNPRGTIPTVDIEGQVLVGFNPQRIEAAIDRAARARLQRL
jgi:glutaredoxin